MHLTKKIFYPRTNWPVWEVMPIPSDYYLLVIKVILKSAFIRVNPSLDCTQLDAEGRNCLDYDTVFAILTHHNCFFTQKSAIFGL